MINTPNQALRENIIEILDEYHDNGEFHERTPLEKERYATRVEDVLLRALPGWTIELPNLPYFQIRAFNDKQAEWVSPIYDTKNLPAVITEVKQILTEEMG